MELVALDYFCCCLDCSRAYDCKICAIGSKKVKRRLRITIYETTANDGVRYRITNFDYKTKNVFIDNILNSRPVPMLPRTLHQDAKLFFALANAIHDAAIATWEAKRFYDYVRPVTAIRHLFRGKKIKGWNGSSVTTINGEAWRPYQVATFPTPPFPEFTSGHSGFSMAAAEVLKRFTGSDSFGASYTQPVPLRVEPNLAAAVGVTLRWDTFTEAALEAGESRLYGGIHFYEGNVSGLSLGRNVGVQSYEKAQGYWSGRI